MASFKQSKQTPFWDFLGGAVGKNPPARAGDVARSLAAAKPVRHDDRGLKPAAWHSARAEATREACPLQRESPSGREGPAQPQQNAVPPDPEHISPPGRHRRPRPGLAPSRVSAGLLPDTLASSHAPDSGPHTCCSHSLDGSSRSRGLSPQDTPVSAHTSPPWDASADNSF